MTPPGRLLMQPAPGCHGNGASLRSSSGHPTTEAPSTRAQPQSTTRKHPHITSHQGFPDQESTHHCGFHAARGPGEGLLLRAWILYNSTDFEFVAKTCKSAFWFHFLKLILKKKNSKFLIAVSILSFFKFFFSYRKEL